MLVRRIRRSPRPVAPVDALEKLLCDRPEDERAGSTATLGFSFQQWWATLRAVELLATGDDFAVAMEVKEDVALLDSATEPTQVEFCQTKKSERENAWNLKELHRPGPKTKDGGARLSTIAKLYRRRHQFTGHKTRLCFVSNASFKVPAPDGTQVNSTKCRLEDLAADVQAIIRKALAEQLSVDEADIDLSGVTLHRTNLPLGEPEKFIAGKLMELSEKGQLHFGFSKPNAAARFLASELQSRGASTNFATSFEDLRERMMSRAEVLDVLVQLSAARPSLEAVLDKAIERLNQETYSFARIRAIERQKIQVCVDVTDRANGVFRQIIGILLVARQSVEIAAGDDAKLGELLDRLVEQVRPAIVTVLTDPNPGYLNAVALLVLNDGIKEDELTSQAGQKSEEEK